MKRIEAIRLIVGAQCIAVFTLRRCRQINNVSEIEANQSSSRALPFRDLGALEHLRWLPILVIIKNRNRSQR